MTDIISGKRSVQKYMKVWLHKSPRDHTRCKIETSWHMHFGDAQTGLFACSEMKHESDKSMKT